MFMTLARSGHVALAAALGTTLIAGCQMLGQQGSTPAAGQADSVCVSRCNLKKTQCEERQKLREQDCQLHQKTLVDEGQSCITHFGSNCVEPVDCLGADLGICEPELQECILDCPPGEPAAAAPPRSSDSAPADDEARQPEG